MENKIFYKQEQILLLMVILFRHKLIRGMLEQKGMLAILEQKGILATLEQKGILATLVYRANKVFKVSLGVELQRLMTVI